MERDRLCSGLWIWVTHFECAEKTLSGEEGNHPCEPAACAQPPHPPHPPSTVQKTQAKWKTNGNIISGKWRQTWKDLQGHPTSPVRARAEKERAEKWGRERGSKFHGAPERAEDTATTQVSYRPGAGAGHPSCTRGSETAMGGAQTQPKPQGTEFAALSEKVTSALFPYSLDLGPFFCSCDRELLSPFHFNHHLSSEWGGQSLSTWLVTKGIIIPQTLNANKEPQSSMAEIFPGIPSGT